MAGNKSNMIESYRLSMQQRIHAGAWMHADTSTSDDQGASGYSPDSNANPTVYRVAHQVLLPLFVPPLPQH